MAALLTFQGITSEGCADTLADLSHRFLFPDLDGAMDDLVKITI